MTSVRLNKAALAALSVRPEVEGALMRVGEQVADRARASAPRDTGAGAESIHAEPAEGFGGTATVRVGWDEDHFYMGFHELGTSSKSARPFLRPALDATYTL